MAQRAIRVLYARTPATRVFERGMRCGTVTIMKTRERNTLAKYTAVVPKKRKILDVRDYIIQSATKRKTNWSQRVDEVLYGAKPTKRKKKPSQIYILKPKPRKELNIHDYIIPTNGRSKPKANISEIDRVVYGL